MSEQNLDRFMTFDRVVNFRDLGGYSTADGRMVRRHRLYRGAALHNMTAEDVRRARQLGIQTVLDLRRPDEIRAGLGPFMAPPVRYHSLPLVPEGGSDLLDERYGRRISADRYFAYLSFGAGPFVAAIELLSRPETYPAIIHCTAGKDRTGVIAAMVLDILGVSAETIVEDYALSTLAAKAAEALRRQLDEAGQIGPIADGGTQSENQSGLLASPSEAMIGFLGRLRDQYGSSRGYFEAQGVQSSVFDQLESLLLK